MKNDEVLLNAIFKCTECDSDTFGVYWHDGFLAVDCSKCGMRYHAHNVWRNLRENGIIFKKVKKVGSRNKRDPK